MHETRHKHVPVSRAASGHRDSCHDASNEVTGFPLFFSVVLFSYLFLYSLFVSFLFITSLFYASVTARRSWHNRHAAASHPHLAGAVRAPRVHRLMHSGPLPGHPHGDVPPRRSSRHVER